MNLILFSEHEQKNSGLFIHAGDPRYKHILHVLKAQVGDGLQAGVLNGQTGTAIIKKISSENIQFEIQLRQSPPAPSCIRLILALPRPKVLGRTIRTITELGVKHIDLVQAARVEKSYWTAHQLKQEHLHTRIVEALSQTRDTQIPTITFNPYFRPFAEDVLRLETKNYNCWVAHPYAEKELPGHFDSPAIVAVGPEGGWVDFEIELFKQIGFQVGHAGPRAMSTGVFIPVLLARGLK